MKLNIQLFAYTKKEWKDLPSKDTPIFAADLNNIENGIGTNDAILASKQDTLVSGNNIKTINGNSILGSGNLDILNMVYPVGSIYMSVNSTSPATLFGGTWEQIKDVFLLSAGDTYKAGATGGEATHTLTKSEIPNYTIGTIPEAVPYGHHNWDNGGITGGDLGNTSSSKTGVANNNDVLTITSGTQWGYKISTDGGGQPHNNMPPYLVVYVWKRTA